MMLPIRCSRFIAADKQRLSQDSQNTICKLMIAKYWLWMVAIVLVFLVFPKLNSSKNARKSNDVERFIQNCNHILRFHLKKLMMWVILKLREKNGGSYAITDKIQAFSDDDEMPVDAVYFNTSSKDGQILLFATSRRKHGLVNTIGILKVPEFSDKFLVLHVFPQSSLCQTKDEQNMLDYYTVAGIKIKSIVPEKEYRIEYNGKMVTDDSNRKEVDVWRSQFPIFNVSNDSSKAAMSKAMALEPWSREYFNLLKSHHQTHMEQFGDLDGTVQIDGKEYSLKGSGMRDHTVGARRDWNDIHHYVFHFLRLSNGNSISVGVASIPVIFRRLVVGFVTNGKDNVNIPIDSCSIDLNQFNRQNPPDSYEFEFIANSESYRVHVDCHSKTAVFMGEQSECCLIEKWCNVDVNGVKGWGAAEWQYKTERNISTN